MAKISRSQFEKCWCENIDFTYADLKNSVFHNAQLTDSNFTFSQIRIVDFSGAAINDQQFQSMLSICDARLPNGTFEYRENLIKYGDADCNRSLIDPWRIDNGSIAMMLFNDSQCHFSAQSTTTSALMSQRISLRDSWDSSFWKISFVELEAQMSGHVSVDLFGKSRNGTIVNNHSISKSMDTSHRMICVD